MKMPSQDEKQMIELGLERKWTTYAKPLVHCEQRTSAA
jgi:hypothetical protein